MGDKFLELAVTDSVRAAQRNYYGGEMRTGHSPANETLSDDEIEFIMARDSFYLSSVSETGWPYIQHRGGKPGLLHVLSPAQLAFADYKGNRQLLSTGNVASSDRVVLFLMDYPQRTRLKILGHARVEDAREQPELVTQLADPDVQKSVERL